MKNIVIAGNILVDIVKTINKYPQPTMLTRIVREERAVGGCVCNTGIDLKVLDESINVVALGVVGNDINGNYVVNEMKKHGINVDGIRKTDRVSTGYTDVMTDANGERTFFNYRGANEELDGNDFANLTCENTFLVHIGYLLLLDKLDELDDKFGTKMAKLLRSLQEKGIRTSIDVVSEDSERFINIVNPALKYCDYVIVNEFEAGKAFGINPRDKGGKISISSLTKILQEFKKSGVRRKAIVHCPELGAIIDEDNNVCIVNSFDLPKDYIKGSVGAGDAFCAGALLGILKEYDNEKILRLATCVATNNLQVMDSVSGAKKENEAWVLEKQLKRRTA